MLLTLLTGCKDDAPAAVTNTLTYDGKTYEIKVVKVANQTATDYIRTDSDTGTTHDVFTIFFGDADFEVKTNPWDMSQVKFLALVVVAFPATGDIPFKSGTFNSIKPSEYYGGKAPRTEFYSTFLLRLDLNGDGEFKADDGEFLDGSQGKLTLTVNGTNMTLDIDATQSETYDGGPTKVHYEGAFTSFDY